MADIASLNLRIDYDSVGRANTAVEKFTATASASERAAQRWGATVAAAGRSSEEFSRRVRKTIADLEFERQQLARNATEQARFLALRRAGVSASSAEGQAITASIRALQAQEAAYERTSARAEVYRKAKFGITLAVTAAIAALTALAKTAFEAAAGMGELAEQVGVTAETFQALQFAAVQNGIKTEQLETGLTKFSQKMGEAAEGSKEMIEALDKLGVKNLDAQGKLRPTEDLLTDVARAISEIDDPARRSAAAVDFFGKAGTKMLPILAQIAQGTDAMAASAANAGAMISTETSTKLDEFGDRLDRAKLIARAWAAETLAATIDASRAFAEFDDKVTASVANAFKDLGRWADETLGPIGDKIGQEGARAGAMFIEAFASLPDALGRLFTNAWEAARVATAKGINSITSWLSQNAPWLGIKGTQMDTTPAGAGPAFGGVGERITAAGQAAADDMAQRQAAARAAVERERMLSRQAAMQDDEARARVGKLGVVGTATTGSGLSAIKGAGKEAEDAEKKYAKLITTLTTTADAQDKMTAAARAGETQFEAMKIHLDAQQKAFEIYGKVLDETDPKLRKIEEILTRIAQGKAAEAFNVATTELGRQNEVLEAQIRLMNERPEIQAREIALIKVKQEAEKAGKAITQADVDARLKVVETNERLKAQAEELKQAQELWTAPLKRALEDIQSTAADAFETMLSEGKFNFEELGNVFKKIVTRMAAEFLALATVRPVMNILVNAIGGGGGMSFGGSGMLGGGGGMLGGLFGGASGGGLSGFFNRPIDSGWGSLPAGHYGPVQPGLGGITWGQGLGALGGAGMGIYQLARGGGSTGSTIGGIASLVGAGVSLIPGIGQIAGPIIGMLGSILPGLFGESKPEPPTVKATGNLSFGAGGSTTISGSEMNGAQSLTGVLGDVAKSIKEITDAAGGLRDVAGGFAIDMETFSKGEFSNGTIFVTTPGGGRRQWGQSSDPRMQEHALNTASAHIAHAMLMESKSISDNMRSGLAAYGRQNLNYAFTKDELTKVIGDLKAFDNAIKFFGRDVTESERALTELNESFDTLVEVAKKYELGAGEIARVEAERTRQQRRLAEDFTGSIARDLMSPVEQAMKDIGDERAARYLENEALKKIPGFVDQAANIEAAYQRKRLKIMEEANAAALAAQIAAARALNEEMINSVTASVTRAQDLIRSLTPGGALGNVDPRTQLAGLRATYAASFAQAMASPLDQAVVQRAVEDARTLAETSLRFNAGSEAYERDRQMILEQQQALQGAVTGAGMNQTTDTALKALLQQLLTATQSNVDPERDAKMTSLINLLLRFFADKAAA